MRVLVLGADGYLGWPTALHFSAREHTVALVDSYLRRSLHEERGTASLTPIATMPERISAWREITGETLPFYEMDITDHAALSAVIAEFEPEAIIDYAEIPSAPYSMIDVRHAVLTQRNNVEGTLNLLWAMHEFAPDAHLVKLGTMGEYGTPNIDIEEGYLDITHKGRTDRMPFPKQPGSFYHLSKVHDSDNIAFATRVWGLRATDLNQGVVHGIDTPETALHDALVNRFDYDEVFGTALNRFCVQALTGSRITIYGSGNQRRGFLNIRDTLQCVELAVTNPAARGEFRVLNQFTEVFSIRELADTVARCVRRLGTECEIAHLDNPRVESEDHYYNPSNKGLLDLGLKPVHLDDDLLASALAVISRHTHAADDRAFAPVTTWR